MVTATWTLMRPVDESEVECMAGSECGYLQKNGRPSTAYGYWTINSINIRACSRECAEKVVFHINERFKSNGT